VSIDIEKLFSIRGKTAVVTGGSRGIGYMIAEGFVRAGARVYICARKAEACDAAAAELARVGECFSIPADLSNESGAKAFADAVAARESHLDILVNNAGAAWGAPFDEFPDAAFDKVMNINVKAIFNLTKFFLPLLRAAATEDDPARVINIGSVDGLVIPISQNYSYSASKAAVHMLTRHSAHALVKEHITVNAIAPGLFPSKMTSWIFDGGAAEETISASVPMGRHGRAEDIAGTAIFLSSRAGAYLTGTVIPVAGGIATID